MSQKRAKLTHDLRAAQGQSDPHEVAGKVYVFRKLKGKNNHGTLKRLVGPFVRAVESTMQAVSMPLSEILSGEVEIDLSEIDLAKAVEALDALSEDEYWLLAQRILDGVEIDGVAYGKLDNHTYFDDKHLEIVQAIFKGIQVSYPFVSAMTPAKESGSTDSSTSPSREASVEPE